MASTKEIKRRIKSVKNTKKITKAMELVAASKMKRAVSSALSSRLYAEYSWQVLQAIALRMSEISHPLFSTNESDRDLLVLFTSNRGLCGSYNAQAIKKALIHIKSNGKNHLDVVSIGRKGDSAMRRVGANIIASFTEIPDKATLSDVLPLAKLITGEYLSGNYANVYVVFTDFVSPLVQKPNLKQILPVSRTEFREFIENIGEGENAAKSKTDSKVEYIFEGDLNSFAGMLAEKLIRMQIYQMLLESNASEQSARMLAMKNASEASGEMIDELTLVFNKARQASITREISEISAGMAVME